MLPTKEVKDTRQVALRHFLHGQLQLVAEQLALFKIGFRLSIFTLFTIYDSAVVARSGITGSKMIASLKSRTAVSYSLL